jgi:hypothetical protein
MTGTDLIGFLLPSKGIRRKYGQLTEVDHYLTVAGGAR